MDIKLSETTSIPIEGKAVRSAIHGYNVGLDPVVLITFTDGTTLAVVEVGQVGSIRYTLYPG